MSATSLKDLPTPSLILDLDKMQRNIKRMSDHIGGLGGVLRPHVKTQKSIDVTRAILAGGNAQGITVSTLREADYFHENGVSDILYAVGIAPNKFDHAAKLMDDGCDLTIALDSVEMARLVAEDGAARNRPFKVMIELDTDGHRSGAQPEGEALLEIGAVLNEAPGAELVGVMTHAGESYNCRTTDSLLALARQERDRTVLAAERLRAAGVQCPVVSIGSTPTAIAIDDLSGVTEVRAGVYVFFDLVMAGVGVCTPEDVAVSVLASVIGYQKEKDWVITDGGWMAMSRDRGTANQPVDYGYGLVTDIAGAPIGDLIVGGANQEHGVVSSRTGDIAPPFNEMPLGSMVRVLPNHACATSGQFDHYNVVRNGEVIAEWPRISGW